MPGEGVTVPGAADIGEGNFLLGSPVLSILHPVTLIRLRTVYVVYFMFLRSTGQYSTNSLKKCLQRLGVQYSTQSRLKGNRTDQGPDGKS